MATDLRPEEKLALIKSQLQEVLHEDILEQVILKEKRSLVIYWGTAPTGRPHCGYFVPMVKLAHFLRAGCTVKVLLADVHAVLDSLKATQEDVKHRAKYYEFVIKSLLRAIDVPIDNLDFILGSTYQYNQKYREDLDKIQTQTTVDRAIRAGAEVVKQTGNPLISSIIYPLMQALDEEHLRVDAQFGGVDQRKIFALAQELLPRMDYRERAHLMNPMVPGLAGGKMSASDPNSKIDILDTPEVIKKKVQKAVCVAKVVEGNGVIAFVEYVLLPIAELKGKSEFVVERGGRGDGEGNRKGEGSLSGQEDVQPLIYVDIAQLKDDYANDVLTPQFLKAAVTRALTAILAPIQAEFEGNKEWQAIEALAYPPEPSAKKIKKEKNRGTRHPGAVANGVEDGVEKLTV